MASPLSSAACAVAALLFWTALGWCVGVRLLPRGLALPGGPALGWALHNAVALPLLMLFGFSAGAVETLAATLITAAALLARQFRVGEQQGHPTVPIWAFLGAAALALAPAAAVIPEHIGAGVVVAKPIFDHAKVAMVDGMARLGLPPANPFFGEFGEPGRLAYYYLWHFGAAQLALALGASGWEADIALTWFSAFASLALMMGLAVWFSARAVAALWVLAFAATGSLRFMLGALLGKSALDALLAYPTGFAGWLFQAAWVPQHIMAATCALLSMFLLSRLMHFRSICPPYAARRIAESARA